MDVGSTLVLSVVTSTEFSRDLTVGNRCFIRRLVVEKVSNDRNKFQFDLGVRHFSHEPPARVIAQALPVLDVKFHLHFFFYKNS